MDKSVELREAKYIVFTDYGADNDIEGFHSYEDAITEVRRRRDDKQSYSGTFDHYIVEAMDYITANYD